MGHLSKSDPPQLWICRLVILLFPPPFRRRFGAEVVGSLKARCADELESSNPVGRSGWWARVLFDLVRTAVREWIHLMTLLAMRSNTESHDERAAGPALLESLRIAVKDFQLAVRALFKHRMYSLVIIVTIAIGVGGATAMFSLVYSILIRPLDYPDPDQLVAVYGTSSYGDRGSISPPNYLDYRDQTTTLQLAAMTGFPTFDITGGEVPERLRGALVSHNFFDVLGTSPLLGRGFIRGEERLGSNRVVVLSHELWQRRFGGDPGVVGSSVMLNEESHAVVGVLPKGLPLFGTLDVYAPIPFDHPQISIREANFLDVFGRMGIGVDMDMARADVDAIAAGLAGVYPESNAGRALALVPLHDDVVGSSRAPVLVLFGAVTAVLLIACANVSSVTLARSSARQTEIAIRSALGGSKSRLLRLLLAESMTLAAIGGGMGVILSMHTVNAVRLMRTGLPRTSDLRVDGLVLTFALLVTVGAGLLSGIVPALGCTRSATGSFLAGAGRSSAPRGRQRFRSVLVATQVAISVVLLSTAGLMLRSFARLQDVSVGFEPAGILTTSLSLPQARYPSELEWTNFYDELMTRLGSTSGVSSIAAADIIPYSGVNNDTYAYPESAPPPEDGARIYAQIRWVTEDYFNTLGMPLHAGRGFERHDGPDTEQTIVLSDAMARALFPNEDPLGQRILVDYESTEAYTVVGVVGDIVRRRLSEPPGRAMYLSLRQSPRSTIKFVMRTAAEPESFVPTTRSILRELDANIPLAAVAPMSQLISRSSARPRFRTMLLGTFAAVGLALAAFGLYGILAYLVIQRQRELGIRMALGASSGNVRQMVLRRGMALVAVGIAVGTPAAYLAARLSSGLLFGVSPTDPVSFIGVVGTLAVVTFVAALVPAHRATCVDPILAIRNE